MAANPSVAERLARLAADQRAAATAPPGPILCIAPAGSGKTTTLVARIAWLVAGGVDPGAIAAITFNRRAAEELGTRLDEALTPLGFPPRAIRVRTFHALGLEILADAGLPVGPLVDRVAVIATLLPDAGPAARAELDTAISRLKVELGVAADDVARDPSAGPVARAFVAYERGLAASGLLDFDDLVSGALHALEADGDLLDRWRARCEHLLVDEIQDVDRAQLGLALLLAAPGNRIFLVGDDDQSIYGWRLADVRRIFGLASRLPGLARHHLVTNYRCPRPVVERSTRLIGGNRERFHKEIRAGPEARGQLVLAPDAGDDLERIGRVVDSWPDDGSSRAILARTNAELIPAAAAALARAIPFRSRDVDLPLEAPALDRALEGAILAAAAEPATPALILLGWLRGEAADLETTTALGMLLGWAPTFATIGDLAAAVAERRAALRRLRSENARLALSTAHATKGLEFDHVLVLMDADRFPSRRALDDAPDEARALEEERRLAYVAWTRARRSLTLLYDPAAPSRFLLEAFDRRELG
jgi:DNA helicase-2/ATP-dependent DNA helicase PcrA